jgi:hypothetical protein
MPDRKHVDDDYRKATARYSVSSMSNAKWVKLLTAVARSGIGIVRSQWKYIDDGRCVWNAMPSEDDLLPNRFADGRFQPLEYKWIEWVFVPHEFATVEGAGHRTKQDTHGLLRVIREVGQFDFEESPEGVRLYAYRP